MSARQHQNPSVENAQEGQHSDLNNAQSFRPSLDAKTSCPPPNKSYLALVEAVANGRNITLERDDEGLWFCTEVKDTPSTGAKVVRLEPTLSNKDLINTLVAGLFPSKMRIRSGGYVRKCRLLGAKVIWTQPDGRTTPLEMNGNDGGQILDMMANRGWKDIIQVEFA